MKRGEYRELSGSVRFLTETTPATASGLTDRVWTVGDIVRMMDPEMARIG